MKRWKYGGARRIGQGTMAVGLGCLLFMAVGSASAQTAPTVDSLQNQIKALSSRLTPLGQHRRPRPRQLRPQPLRLLRGKQRRPANSRPRWVPGRR